MMGELFHLDLQKEMPAVLVSMCLSPVIFSICAFLVYAYLFTNATRI